MTYIDAECSYRSADSVRLSTTVECLFSMTPLPEIRRFFLLTDRAIFSTSI
jgi:hypothetical protein